MRCEGRRGRGGERGWGPSRPSLFLFGALLAACCLLGVSCRPPPADDEPSAPPWFRDVTEECGLRFVHDAGPTGGYFMPQIMGSGAALFDFDNDGRLDVYLLQNGGPDSRSTNRLFRQEADGRFKDVSAGSGLDVAGYGMGAAVGDVNNDGRPDVLVTEYGRLRLFLNNGDGTFTDVTKEAGLGSVAWGTSACFFDYDRDGWLDLVVVNYLDYSPSRPCGDARKPDYCHPNAFGGTVARLYHNLGPLQGKNEGRGAKAAAPVRFEDVTLKSGLGRLPGPGLGVVCADFDGDGWPDIFVANDSKPNHLWINQKDGTFKEEAVLRGLAYNALGRAQANMGVALGDVSGGGRFDLYVTHLTEETNTLWRQGPRGLFRDETAAAGLAGSRWRGTGFGTVLGDFDHDGALDLAVVNGRVARSAAPPAGDFPPDLAPFWRDYAERNQLFANEGGGRFRDVSPENKPFCGTAAVARGLACGDLDGDGALDLLVTTVAGPARLYRNVAPNRGHWLLVRALDPALKRDAYGAVVTVRAGGRRWRRWVNPGSSYLCSNDPRAHFGLGPAERVDAVEVLWPDGSAEVFPGGAADRVVVLRKGEGKPAGT
jgi:enediyne biosynthesis protein E4